MGWGWVLQQAYRLLCEHDWHAVRFRQATKRARLTDGRKPVFVRDSQRHGLENVLRVNHQVAIPHQLLILRGEGFLKPLDQLVLFLSK